MTVTFPRNDILTTYPIAPEGYKFQPMYRQELSRQANGVTLIKDFGTSLWTLAASSVPLFHADALDFEAMLSSMDNGIGTFHGFDARRPYPRSKPDGIFSDTSEISTVGGNGKSLALSGLPAGMVLSRGDHLAFNVAGWRSLHQVMETVTASGPGVSPLFEVRPHLFPGTTVGLDVTLKQPATVMMLVPGSVVPQQFDALKIVISFQAFQCPIS